MAFTGTANNLVFKRLVLSGQYDIRRAVFGLRRSSKSQRPLAGKHIYVTISVAVRALLSSITGKLILYYSLPESSENNSELMSTLLCGQKKTIPSRLSKR